MYIGPRIGSGMNWSQPICKLRCILLSARMGGLLLPVIYTPEVGTHGAPAPCDLDTRGGHSRCFSRLRNDSKIDALQLAIAQNPLINSGIMNSAKENSILYILGIKR